MTSKTPAELGETVTFTATVNAEAGILPTGTVDFYDGGIKLGSSALDGAGQANYAVNTLSAGEHQITANYLGDSECTESTSAPLTQMINTIPTAITVAAFHATQIGDGVFITWETSLGINIAGFNIYRADSSSGVRQKVNSALVPVKAPGQTSGSSYEWLDKNIKTFPSYWYWLEIKDIAEETTWHGPTQVALQVYTPLILTNP